MKKITILILLVFGAGLAASAQTKSIVPRADGEGGLGTALKQWGFIYALTNTADYFVGDGSGLAGLPLAAIGNITNTPASGQTNALEVTGDKYRWVVVQAGGGSGTTYTNNASGLPGVIDPATQSIGTNLSTLATAQSVIDSTNTARLTSQILTSVGIDMPGSGSILSGSGNLTLGAETTSDLILLTPGIVTGNFAGATNLPNWSLTTATTNVNAGGKNVTNVATLYASDAVIDNITLDGATGTVTATDVNATGQVRAASFTTDGTHLVKLPARDPTVGQILVATNTDGSVDWSNQPPDRLDFRLAPLGIEWRIQPDGDTNPSVFNISYSVTSIGTPLVSGNASPNGILYTNALAAGDDAGFTSAGSYGFPATNEWRWSCTIQVTNSSNARIWVGMSSTSVASMDSQDPNNRSVAAFRLSTNSANWFLYTADSDSASSTATDTGIAVTDTITCLEMVRLTNFIVAYINNTAVATNTTDLPKIKIWPLLSIHSTDTELDGNANGIVCFGMAGRWQFP